jgi:tetrachlorobenzoquinone reductase
MIPAGAIKAQVKAARWEAPDINSYELQSPNGESLPPFTAGAHIDLILPNGLTRSYSIINPQRESHRYVIAVQKDRASRGGSTWIYENLTPGLVIPINGPRNNFPLYEAAPRSVFIAGGIGITPILSMIQRLSELRQDWRLYYCARTKAAAAFVDVLDGPVTVNFDQEPGGRLLDLAAIVRSATPDTHFYCCGPAPMLETFANTTRDLPAEQVHLEYFTSNKRAATDGQFTVVLARTNREIMIPAGQSILSALLNLGVDIPYSCKDGVCGSCETRVLDGIPDHRDMVLSKEEQESNSKMMLCCSGCKSEKLVLDL